MAPPYIFIRHTKVTEIQQRIRGCKSGLAQDRLAPVCLYRQADLASNLGDPKLYANAHLCLRKDYFDVRKRRTEEKEIRDETSSKANR